MLTLFINFSRTLGLESLIYGLQRCKYEQINVFVCKQFGYSLIEIVKIHYTEPNSNSSVAKRKRSRYNDGNRMFTLGGPI